MSIDTLLDSLLEKKPMNTKKTENARLWALKAYELTKTYGSYQAKNLNNYHCYAILNRVAIEKGFVEKANRCKYRWIGAEPTVLTGEALRRGTSAYWQQADSKKTRKGFKGFDVKAAVKAAKTNGSIRGELKEIKSLVKQLQIYEKRIVRLEDTVKLIKAELG